MTEKKPFSTVLFLAFFTSSLLALVVAFFVGLLNQKFPQFQSLHTLELQKSLSWDNPSWIFLQGLFPALYEEVFFRGILHWACLKKGEKTAWIVPNLFFGVFHLHPYLAPIYFLIWMFFSYWRVRSQGLVAPIIAHFAFNLTGILLILSGL